MGVPLRSPDYSGVSKRAKSARIRFKTPIRGEIAHLVIDSTGLKVFGEGEWKAKNGVEPSGSSIWLLTATLMKSAQSLRTGLTTPSYVMMNYVVKKSVPLSLRESTGH